MEPSPCTLPGGKLMETFPKSPRPRSEASQFSGSHNYKTKQSYVVPGRKIAE